MGSSARFDPIAVVEAAYDLDGTLEQWLERLARVVRPDLDCGLGTQAACYSHRGDMQPRLDEIALSGTPPGLREFCDRIVQTLPAEGSRRLFGRPPGLWTFGEVMAGHGRLQRFYADRIVSLEGREIRDWKAFMATDGGPWVLMVGGFSGRWVEIRPLERRVWQRLSAYVAAGARLVRSLSAGELAREEAVLDSSGRMLHAEGEARSRTARERLQQAVRRSEHARGRMRRDEPMRALELWRGLIDGRWSLVDRFESAGRRLIIALRNESPYRDPRALTARQRRVAQLASLGHSNKEIAYALGSSESAVGTHVAAILRRLRLGRREELVRALASSAVVTEVRIGADPLAVMSEADVALPGALSAAERAAVRGVLGGLSDAAIAAGRGVAVRTVSNQLRSAFRKLGVRSRAELVARVHGSAEQGRVWTN